MTEPSRELTPVRGGAVVADPRLGRVVQFDPRSRNYPVRALLTPVQLAKLRSYTWSIGETLDQGQEGSCVGHGIAHEIAARPVVGSADHTKALEIYHQAQTLDEWPGESYEGTSVLAGMKAATAMGYYDEYRWAFGLEDLVSAVGYRGPAVLGINWYSAMFSPDADGFIHVGGTVAGGHCILMRGIKIRWASRVHSGIDGVDLDASYALLHNSWGPGWGDNGDAKLSLRDLSRLLGEGGEAAIPVRRIKQ